MPGTVVALLRTLAPEREFVVDGRNPPALYTEAWGTASYGPATFRGR